MTFHARNYTPAQIAAHEAHKARQARMSPPVTKIIPPAPKPAKEEPKPASLRALASWERRRAAESAAGYPTLTSIIETVAEAYGVSEIDIISMRRTIYEVVPRQVAMYLSKELTLNGYSDIGRRFGDRDHTTALHGWRRIRDRLKWDADLAEKVAALRATLGFEVARKGR